jgi:hypothetical protein
MAARLRITSGRAYRRLLEQALSDVLAGERTPSDGAKIAQMCRQGYEMLLQEQVAALQGVTVIESDFYAAGEDGGEEITERLGAPATRAIEKSITLRRGVDGEGNEVEEQTVTLKGGATLTLQEVEEQLKASAPKLERRHGSLAPVKPEHDAEVVEMVRRSR